MKVSIKAGNSVIEVEGKSVKDIFKELAEAAEIFSNDKCGVCGSQNVIPKVRRVDSNDYYEYSCNCGAKLAFGQNKTGNSLFPKRKVNENGEIDNEGKYDTRNHGWHKWTPSDPPEEKKEESKVTRRR